MRQATQPGRVRVLDIEPKRNVTLTAPIGLHPDWITVGKRDGPRVIKAAHSLQRAKGVIERPILLHQDDDVLGIPKCTSRFRLDGQRLRMESTGTPAKPAAPESKAALLRN